MNSGKRFEQKFKATFAPHVYTLRIPDSVYMLGERLVGNETEADFIVVTGGDSYLVECKATHSKSLELRKVLDHQVESLLAFDAIGEHTHGMLAVEFYDKASYRRPHRMFILPIKEWAHFKETSTRQSMPISYFEEHGVEFPYLRGAYDFSAWTKVEELTRD